MGCCKDCSKGRHLVNSQINGRTHFNTTAPTADWQTGSLHYFFEEEESRFEGDVVWYYYCCTPVSPDEDMDQATVRMIGLLIG